MGLSRRFRRTRTIERFAPSTRHVTFSRRSSGYRMLDLAGRSPLEEEHMPEILVTVLADALTAMAIALVTTLVRRWFGSAAEGAAA